MILTMLKSRTPRQKFFTVAGIVGGLAVLILLGGILPLFLHVQQLSSHLRETMKNHVNEEARFHAGQTTSQDLKLVDPTIKHLKTYFLGDDRDLTVTLNTLEALAGEYGIDMRTPQLLSGSSETTSLGLTLQGPFSSLMDFMRRLEQFPKFSKIESFGFGSIQSANQSAFLTPQLTGSILFTIYLPPDPSKLQKQGTTKPKNTGDSIDN